MQNKVSFVSESEVVTSLFFVTILSWGLFFTAYIFVETAVLIKKHTMQTCFVSSKFDERLWSAASLQWGNHLHRGTSFYFSLIFPIIPLSRILQSRGIIFQTTMWFFWYHCFTVPQPRLLLESYLWWLWNTLVLLSEIRSAIKFFAVFLYFFHMDSLELACVKTFAT